MLKRRLGQNDVNLCPGGYSCPQIFETTDGNFAAAGLLITTEAKEAIKALPSGPGIGPNEGVVKLPRAVVIGAIVDILKVA